MAVNKDKLFRFDIPSGTAESEMRGDDDIYFKIISQRSGVQIRIDDGKIYLQGSSNAKRRTVRDTILELAAAVREKKDVSERLVHAILDKKLPPQKKAIPAQKPANQNIIKAFNGPALIMNNKKIIEARTDSQAAYLKTIFNNSVTFGVGPAGTGKTFLAVATAVYAFENDDNIKRIILTRPAVEAGERLGFLPGTSEDKINPYLQPLYDALYEMKDFRIVDNLKKNGGIEVAPLALMRGRTLSDAVVILDEAQNTTVEQMKMFVTRIGENTKYIITGDVTQNDLPEGVESGLKDILQRVAAKNPPGVAVHRFGAGDVVRSEICGHMVGLYEEDENGPEPGLTPEICRP